MRERINRSERVVVAQQQLAARAESTCIRLNARILELRQRQELLLAEMATTHGRFLHLYARHLDRVSADLRTAEAERNEALAELLRRKRLLEAWQRRVALLCAQYQQQSARIELAETIEAALVAPPVASLP